MIILKKEWHAPSKDPTEVKPAPARHQIGMKPRVGEMVILMDYPDAKDWYLAEISRATRRERARALKRIFFLRTLCKDKGKGIASTIPPAHLKGKEKYWWKWRLPVGETDQLLLIRNVILDKDDCLCKATRELAEVLKFAHHVGAGSEETAS
jgi:hypothetical protein